MHHAKDDAKLALDSGPDDDALSASAPDQSPHEGNVVPLADRDASHPRPRFGDRLGVLLGRAGLARQGRLVDFEAVRLREADVGRDAVARVEGDEVAGDEHVGEDGRFLAIPAVKTDGFNAGVSLFRVAGEEARTGSSGSSAVRVC